MAKLNVKTTVTAPDEISVQLIRADYLGISNTFRILFELFLAVTCSLLGVVLSATIVTTTQKLFLAFTGLGTASFLVLSIYYYCVAKPNKSNIESEQ